MVTNSFSAIIQASSGSPADLQSAIDAANAGDTVLIPAGDFTFEETVYVKGGINLFGAGINKTILRRQGELYTFAYMLKMDCSNGLPSRISGIELIGNGPPSSKRMTVSYSGLAVEGSCQDFRVDHCRFEYMGTYGAAVVDSASGVVDHCEFINNFTYHFQARGDGDLAFNRPLALGSKKSVFIEDNYFEGKNWAFIDGSYGSRYVARYNKFKVTEYMPAGAIIIHGSRGPNSYPERAARSWEIYNNTIESNGIWSGIEVTGGDGVIFNNTLIGQFTREVVLSENQDGCNYPCLDQIRESYVWNNTANGQPANVIVHNGSIEDGRDYFLYPRPGYVPYPYPHPLINNKPVQLGPSALKRNSGIGLDNYPNPFKMRTKIVFEINETNSSQVNKKLSGRLNLYDLQGNLIKTLTYKSHSAGLIEMNWNGDDFSHRLVPNGVYLIKLKLGSRTYTKKMLMMK